MDNLIMDMIVRDAGKTVIELRMDDGSVRRFCGRPSETADVHRLGGGPVRLLVVQDASEFKKPNAEALRDHGPLLDAMIQTAVDRALPTYSTRRLHSPRASTPWKPALPPTSRVPP